MIDPRSNAPSPHAGAEVPRDLQALAAESHRGVPALDDSLTAARRRHRAAPRWKELLMPVTTASRRPWLVAATALLVVVAGAMFPISWQRTVGHDVALTLTGVHDVAQAGAIAREMKSVLGADHVSVRTTADGAGTTLAFGAYVPSGQGVDAASRMQALAAALRAHGFTASTAITPRRAQVAGTVYAYARDLVIRVSTDGKTPAQIETEIRQQLAAAGLTNTTVSVTDQNGRREVKVTAENHDPGASPADVRLELTKDGQTLNAGSGLQVEVRRTRSSDGETLRLDISDKGRTATVQVPHADTMSDAALQAAVESQLRAAGLDLVVSISGGKVSIDERR
jgi:hypothetical protein